MELIAYFAGANVAFVVGFTVWTAAVGPQTRLAPRAVPRSGRHRARAGSAPMRCWATTTHPIPVVAR